MSKLELLKNLLTGTLPTELSLASNLNYMHICCQDAANRGGDMIEPGDSYDHGTGFTGPLPSEFGQLTNLETLQLNVLSLTGTIPSQIGLATALKSFKLVMNPITGAIPSELALVQGLQGWKWYQS